MIHMLHYTICCHGGRWNGLVFNDLFEICDVGFRKIDAEVRPGENYVQLLAGHCGEQRS